MLEKVFKKYLDGNFMTESKTYDAFASEKKWESFWKKNKIYAFDPKSGKKVFSIDTHECKKLSQYLGK